ncbi:hypothetical protein BGZ99_001271 [Dissophora globulifera]|uniref:Uncharacterized protein n=1 Tax=Dissophora globulifera TaxID=979702 RepID=A0A9P6R2X8_9FUNG|nr:hypothetical protein BGZ99_001271 [Dissophora globulifera]
MDTYHCEYIVPAAAAAAEASAKAKVELKAKLEYEIEILRDQVAHLQRQQRAVDERRRRMFEDANEQHRMTLAFMINEIQRYVRALVWFMVSSAVCYASAGSQFRDTDYGAQGVDDDDNGAVLGGGGNGGANWH